MAPDLTYDVFLSHSSQDKPAVEELARRLKRRRLKPFLDKWHLVPGEPWQEALEEALEQSRTFAIFLGPGGLGPWQNEEMRDALDTRARDKSRRVIPVLLPGASMPKEKALPLFLRRLAWVDFRGGLDDPEALHRLVCGIKGIPPKGGSAPLIPPTQPSMIGVPHRNPFFTGREALLLRLHEQLQAQGISALAQSAIHGLGGIGKTQTAIEYAHRFGPHYRFVLWVVAEEESAIRSAYLSIAREMRLIEAQTDLKLAVLAVKTWLSHKDNWLLIFDNADNPALVRPYLPVARTGGKVLLTSRAKTFADVGISEPFSVETMDPADAVAFLLKRTKRDEVGSAAELSKELGYLPLALDQAAAYIDTVGVSISEYLASFKRRGLQLLEKGKASADYPHSIATTWNLSFTNVKKASPASAELLIAIAFLLPDSVPIEIFTRSRSELGDLLAEALKDSDDEPLVFWETLTPLERYSLVERLSENTFKVHRLTQEVVKESLTEEGRRAWAERVVRALNAAYPWVEIDTWTLCERLQPLAKSASELIRTYSLGSATEVGQLFNKAGLFAWIQLDHTGAKLFNELSLEIRELVLGARHPDTAIARINLAETLRALGDLAGAKKLEECDPLLLWRVNYICSGLGKEVKRRLLGSQHPDSIVLRNDLARDLSDRGRYFQERLDEQTREIFKHVLEGRHPNTLRSRGNLAEKIEAISEIAVAKQLHEQTLELRERRLGSEHPETTVSAWNLLLTVRRLKDSKAEAQLIEKLRWLLNRTEDSIPSAIQRGIRRMLIALLNLS